MSLHSEILYPDSPLLFLNAAWRGKNYQVYSRWFDGSNPLSTALEVRTLAIMAPIYSLKFDLYATKNITIVNYNYLFNFFHFLHNQCYRIIYFTNLSKHCYSHLKYCH